MQKNNKKIFSFEEVDKLVGDHIVIPDEYTEIEKWAFMGRMDLVNVVIPDSVITIGDSAFESCDELCTIMIPRNVVKLGRNVFDCCKKLETIYVDEGNSEYISEEGVLFNKDKTVLIKYPQGKTQSTYDIPYGVRVINESGFKDVKSLKSINIPNSVIKICDQAFTYCKLENIRIPSSVTSIGRRAFSECLTANIFVDLENMHYSDQNGVLFNKNKTELIKYPSDLIKYQSDSYIVPDGVTEIGEYAFCRSPFLKHVTLSRGITQIGRNAFDSCFYLAEIVIPKSVKYIGKEAFKSCINLTYCKFKTTANAETSIEESAFDCCEKLTIKCLNNSDVHIYAQKNGIRYEII